MNDLEKAKRLFPTKKVCYLSDLKISHSEDLCVQFIRNEQLTKEVYTVAPLEDQHEKNKVIVWRWSDTMAISKSPKTICIIY
tara:strand:+ start:8110 stop:8355 length:246 start_codon:yes stop_codon:yes gene_type:complete